MQVARSKGVCHRFDSSQNLRVITNPLTFEEMLHTAFEAIWDYGHEDARVAGHLFDTLHPLEDCREQEERRTLLRDYIAVRRYQRSLLPEASPDA